MSIEHAHPRADNAARTVDPYVLATALDHIACSAAKSRSQTRRIRWIQQRAEIALRGDEYRDIDVDLPKSAGPNTQEKLNKRLSYELAIKHRLLEALQAIYNRHNAETMAQAREAIAEAMRAAA